MSPDNLAYTLQQQELRIKTLEQQVDYLRNAHKNQKIINKQTDEKLTILIEGLANLVDTIEVMDNTDNNILNLLTPLVHEYKSRAH